MLRNAHRAAFETNPPWIRGESGDVETLHAYGSERGYGGNYEVRLETGPKHIEVVAKVQDREKVKVRYQIDSAGEPKLTAVVPSTKGERAVSVKEASKLLREVVVDLHHASWGFAGGPGSAFRPFTDFFTKVDAGKQKSLIRAFADPAPLKMLRSAILD
jgi:hypothetical protein